MLFYKSRVGSGAAMKRACGAAVFAVLSGKQHRVSDFEALDKIGLVSLLNFGSRLRVDRFYNQGANLAVGFQI